MQPFAPTFDTRLIQARAAVTPSTETSSAMIRLVLMLGLVCGSITGVPAADGQELPQFIVPGFETEMAAMEQLLKRHHSPRSTCTLWDAWLPMSTLWPAIGSEGTESAQTMRDFYRRSLLTRHVDTAGYVSMNQHKGLAHPGGWPFPIWQQAAGVGWHFTHAHAPYARSLNTPLADLTGWQWSGAPAPQVDRQTGLVVAGQATETTLTTPAFSTAAFVSPFVVIEWSLDRLPRDARPFLEWTTATETEFSAQRRIEISLDDSKNTHYGGAIKLTAIPAHRHPQWRGQITRLRLGWKSPQTTPDSPLSMTIRALHTAVDTRHPITGSLFVRGCLDYFRWTNDLPFLRENLPRMREAMRFSIEEFAVQKNHNVLVPWTGHDGRAGFDLLPDGRKKIHRGRGVGNNYWDLLPFGHHDFLATLYLFDALQGMAELEQVIANRSAWNLNAPQISAEEYQQLAERVRSSSQSRFWNAQTQRFVACVDADGQAHDYGFTFLNLEAIHYGFANPQQATAILDWLDGRRSVDGDTSQGDDIYHWRFAPRATTRRNVDWYMWAWSGPETIPWGGQVQDGGAVLGFSYHDLMARLRTKGPDDAWQRLQAILTWFQEVEAEGGYRDYYAVAGRGSLQGGGTPGGLGLDHEFMESVLVPQIMLYGFLGFEPTADGVRLQPRLPRDWPSLKVTRIHYRDHVFDLEVTPKAVELTYRTRGASPLQVTLLDQTRQWKHPPEAKGRNLPRD